MTNIPEDNSCPVCGSTAYWTAQSEPGYEEVRYVCPDTDRRNGCGWQSRRVIVELGDSTMETLRDIDFSDKSNWRSAHDVEGIS